MPNVQTELTETEHRRVTSRVDEPGQGKWGGAGQRARAFGYKINKLQDRRYSTVTTVNNTVLDT